MSKIEFSKEEKQQLIPMLQQYLKDELDCEAGSFEAEFLLDFFNNKLGGYIYNRALADVHALLNQQIENMSDSIYDLEKQVEYKK